MRKVSYDHNEEWLQKRLQVLQDVPGRPVEAETAGRVKFLNEAASLRRAAPVQISSRQNFWGALKSFFSPSQARPAFSAVAAVCIVLTILLATGGSMVYAAQGSQPDQMLYPVKLFSEDVALRLAADPETQFQLNMDFANRRLDEIDKLVQAGKAPDEQLTNRLQNELDAALDSAADLKETGVSNALENLRANLNKHIAQLDKLPPQSNSQAVNNITRVVKMLEEKAGLATEGIKDPQSIHELIQQEKIEEKAASKEPPTPTGESSNVAKGTSTPMPEATTGAENRSAQCDYQINFHTGKVYGNGNNCDEPGAQVTAAPLNQGAAVNTPKPTNPNRPDKTSPAQSQSQNDNKKDKPDKGNKGGHGHNK